MRIAFASAPKAGRDFEFDVIETGDEGRVQLYIGDDLMMETTCPDPPCHERVFVPLEAAGNTLLVRAEDAQEANEHVFAIDTAELEPD
jgi:hypothetical protein